MIIHLFAPGFLLYLPGMKEVKSTIQSGIKAFLVSIALFVISSAAHAQPAEFISKLSASDTIADKFPREKIFIHHDKPYYKPNDTLWLKGYVLGAAEHKPADSSGIAYIEIINEEGEVLKRTSAPVFFGLFSSCIALPEDDFKQGAYILRAYTNWMRNFGDSLFFESRFKVIDARSEQWKADIRRIDFSNNHFVLYAVLKGGNATPLAYTNAMVKLRSGLRNYLKLRTATDADGNIYIDTTLKAISTNRNIVLEIASKDDLQLSIPVRNSGTPQIDIQFLPEGGSLVAGIPQNIGFKAISIFGKAVEVSGVIKNSKRNTVAQFASVHKGMGIVGFTPKAGETYMAELSNGLVYDLPGVKTSGIALRVINKKDSDSITVKIIAAQNHAPAVYYLAGRSGGITYAGAKINLTKKEAEAKLAKAMFPQGITKFTLYDSNMNPLNERITFIWHDEAIRLYAAPHKTQYRQKDSVSLKIRSQNTNGAPVTGSFSIAVIDTAQVKFTADCENIISYMLLSADLKGSIEDPWFYIKNPYSEATEALMLTQGWVNYEWKLPQPAFEKEQEFSITGKVTNAFNKPLAHVNVALFGKVGSDGSFFMDTITNTAGFFTFKKFPYFLKDSAGMVLRALNKKNKAFNVGIAVNSKTYPLYTNGTPGYWQDNLLFDTASRKYISNQQLLWQQMKKEGNFLEEVVIHAKRKIQGSKNLNEDGGADQVITEKILDATPKDDLLHVLGRQIPGFPVIRGAPFVIGKSKVEIVIDGTHLGWFEMDPIDILQYYSAEDVKGIEVMKSVKYNLAYQSKFYDPMKINFMDPPVFVEITTKTGEGPFMKKTPGIYLYKPLVPVIAKQFYSPKYTSANEENVFPDLRSTIYWNPDIITDKKGEAEVSFYTSESKSSYLIILQGTDLAGRFGVLYEYLNIENFNTR